MKNSAFAHVFERLHLKFQAAAICLVVPLTYLLLMGKVPKNKIEIWKKQLLNDDKLSEGKYNGLLQ